MDVETIDPGADFPERVRREMESCDVLIALIGKQWLGRRLRAPEDFVRLEIQSALELKLRVIPVLVQGARMPSISQLPISISELSHRHALEISNSRWRHDVERLVGAIQGRKHADNGTAQRTNLPLQLTSFVGRQRELAEIKRTLAQRRLATLTGPGGIGKTRLALQAAREQLGQFRDGVWLIELAALADGSLIAQSIASTLGVREEVGRPLAETVGRFLRGRELLLVIDNCEHLIEPAARLTELLLREAASLRILATSREPFGITGEIAMPIAPLAVPTDGAAAALVNLEEYDGVALFRDRAALAMPSFAFQDQNARQVVEICRQLDGIPLARSVVMNAGGTGS